MKTKIKETEAKKYTVSEFAKKHGKSVSAVKWYIAEGLLKVERVGGGDKRAALIYICQENWPKARTPGASRG